MDEKSEPNNRDETEQLRGENERLREQIEFFKTEHLWGAKLLALIVAGPRLTESFRRWLTRISLNDPFPIEETAILAAAFIRRLLAAGLLGLLITNAPLIWQNILIRDQNQYFREQTGELRKQIAIQEEQGDLVRRKDLLQTVYDGKRAGLSMRVRVEALKAFIALDNKLIDQTKLESSTVNLRGLDLSCDGTDEKECADLSGSRIVRADFTGSNLSGAVFKYADLRDSIFLSADLRGADLSGAIIKGTIFRDRLATGSAVPHIRELMEALVPIWEHRDPKWNVAETVAYRKWIAEFGVSRIALSEASRNAINQMTRASLFDIDTRFPHYDDFDGRFNDDFFFDESTRLPAGAFEAQNIASPRSKFLILSNVGSIQKEADLLFGPYRVNIFSSRLLPEIQGESIHLDCLSTPPKLPISRSRSWPLGLTHVKSLPASDFKKFLRKVCGLPE